MASVSVVASRASVAAEATSSKAQLIVPPTLRDGSGVVLQSDLHSQQFSKAWDVFLQLEPQLLPLSPLLREIASSSQGDVLRRRLLRTVAGSTLLRYLSCAFAYFVRCQELRYNCASLSQVLAMDVLLSLQDSDQREDEQASQSLAGLNMLKALRWCVKIFQPLLS